MKNILAENMRRFGVKNLSESDVETLKNLEEQEQDPKTQTTPVKRIVQTFNTWANGKAVEGQIVANIPMQNGVASTPKSITITQPLMNGSSAYWSISNLNNAEWVLTKTPGYGIGSKLNREYIRGSFAYSLPPKKTITVLNDIVNQINAQTKVKMKLSNEIVDLLNQVESGVKKRASVRPLTGKLEPYKAAELQVTYDSETNQEQDRYFRIGQQRVPVSGGKVQDIKFLWNDMMRRYPDIANQTDRDQLMQSVQLVYDTAVSQLK